jgi:predicted O-linked N-acetylglucosamine transferase (SPINDLY family)
MTRFSAEDQISEPIEALFAQARDAHRKENVGVADMIYRQILELSPRHLGSLVGAAAIAVDRNDFSGAEDLAARAIDADPQFAPAHKILGIALTRAGRAREGLASFDRAITLDPRDGDARFERACALMALDRIEDAVQGFADAAACLPAPTIALYNQGHALFKLGRFREALGCYDRVLALDPYDVGAHNDRGNMLRETGRLDEALAAHDRAIVLQPGLAGAHNNRGIVLGRLGRLDEAVAAYDKAIALRPDLADAYNNRGIALIRLGRLPEAGDSFDRATKLKPDFGEAACLAFDVQARMCDWGDRDDRVRDLVARTDAGQQVEPLILLGCVDDPALQAKAGVNAIGEVPPRPIRARYPEHARPRIAYVSPDFCNHTVAHSTVDVFEHHDHRAFEFFAIALNPSDGSPVRRRLEASFDVFVDAVGKTDLEIATLMREHEIDIAVDLMGHTKGARLGIFARWAAPLQVNWLGYPPPMGASFMNYVIADPVIIPEANRRFFSAPIVYLPETFLPCDTTRVLAVPGPSRAACGLPERGFVFSAYNATYKYTPGIFDLWMRLLREVEGSVLWLNHGNVWAQANLEKEAEARGVARDRLVFAKPIEDIASHLARLALADLALDTLPFTGHSTSCDLLWAGVPIVTCAGNSFQARVTASLLGAAGLPELVVASLDDYHRLALDLARDRARLSSLRGKLARDRSERKLFDSARFCRHLEAVYRGMWERYRRGEPPTGFAV